MASVGDARPSALLIRGRDPAWGVRRGRDDSVHRIRRLGSWDLHEICAREGTLSTSCTPRKFVRRGRGRQNAPTDRDPSRCFPATSCPTLMPRVGSTRSEKICGARPECRYRHRPASRMRGKRPRDLLGRPAWPEACEVIREIGSSTPSKNLSRWQTRDPWLRRRNKSHYTFAPARRGRVSALRWCIKRARQGSRASRHRVGRINVVASCSLARHLT